MRKPAWSGWAEPRPPNAPSRVWRDWVLVAVLVPGVVLEGILRPEVPWRVLSVIVGVGLVCTLLWRRTSPLLMVAIAFAVSALLSLVVGGDSPLSTMGFLLLLPYSLFRWGSGREVVAGSAIMLGNLALSLGLGYLSPGNTAGGLVVLSAACALGAALRYRAGSKLRERDQIRLLERERLARDLHDTVAHHVSAMAIRAQAGLATAGSQAGAAEDALRVIKAEASNALAEMRTMVHALRRSEPAELTPGPRISDLEQLAREAGAGPAVDVDLAGAVDEVPSAVAAAIYRLAQESVTNARRHARHATRIELRVTVDETSVRLRVSDDGETGGLRPGAAPGYGLIGMAERADLLGGTCEAGPGPERGWTVTAVLPRTGPTR
ncbi:sensor histidine kinase [Amycolatopsis sp. GM8]|uniref:sensor histidine kinase n=1 Tax=Amycolatopsis sp. GM8 TaxID=2896530 RepID=UPI001F333BEA|nr:sensor histidine kinase [Amycolatopsis sp. GM8]